MGSWCGGMMWWTHTCFQSLHRFSMSFHSDYNILHQWKMAGTHWDYRSLLTWGVCVYVFIFDEVLLWAMSQFHTYLSVRHISKGGEREARHSLSWPPLGPTCSWHGAFLNQTPSPLLASSSHKKAGRHMGELTHIDMQCSTPVWVSGYQTHTYAHIHIRTLLLPVLKMCISSPLRIWGYDVCIALSGYL